MKRFQVKPWPGLRHAVIDRQTGEPVDIFPDPMGANAAANRLEKAA